MRTTAIRISSGGQIELIVHFPQECHLLLSKIPFGTPTRAAAMHGLSLLMTLQSLDMSQRWKGISSSAFAPVVEDALRRGNQGDWPAITLNLDFKTEEPEHLAAVWALLNKYRDWLTTAGKSASERKVQALDVKPLLVLTGESDKQAKVFYDDVPIGQRLLVFGAVHTNTADPMAAPEILEPGSASNYRRWWNNSWAVVERGGQTQAENWTREDELRLRSLVEHAHANGLWIRFYTLDGATKEELSCHGWFRSYNFGSLSVAQQRWRAAQKVGVDFIASDQYETLANFLKTLRQP